jgi:hypothetical protein
MGEERNRTSLEMGMGIWELGGLVMKARWGGNWAGSRRRGMRQGMGAWTLILR